MPIICDGCNKNVTGQAIYNVSDGTMKSYFHFCHACYLAAQRESYNTEKEESLNQRKENPVNKDPINPSHYRDHPSGVECITITQHENFCIGNAIKYLWRRRKKDLNKEVEDLKKAVWYIQQEIVRLTDGGQQLSKAQSVGKQYEPTK